MKAKFSSQVYVALLVVASSMEQASGQIYPPAQPNRGFYPNGSFAAAQFDSINTVTGNVIAKVPLASLPPGRGGSKFSVDLTYNSTLFDVRTNSGVVPNGTTNGTYQTLQVSEFGGWQLGFQFGLDFEIRSGSGAVCYGPQSSYRIYKMKMRTPDGGVRTLKLQPLQDSGGDGFFGVGPNKEQVCSGQGNNDIVPSGDLIYITTDGSFIRVELSFQTLLPGCTIPTNSGDYWQCREWAAYFPDGSEVRGFGKRTYKFLDKNGNQIVLSNYTSGAGNVVDLIEDGVGRSIEIERFLSPRYDEVRMTGANNALLTWRLYYRDITLASNMYYLCWDGISEPLGSCSLNGDQTYNLIGLDRIELPTQSGGGSEYVFRFDYDDIATRGWGELKKIQFPAREPISGAGQSRAMIQFEYRWSNYVPSSATSENQRNVTRIPENPVRRRAFYYRDGLGVDRSEFTDYEFTKTFSKIIQPDLSERTAYFYDLDQIYDWKKGLVYEENEPQNRKITRSWSRNPPFSQNDAFSSANAYAWTETTQIGIRGTAKAITRTNTPDRNGNTVISIENEWTGAGRVLKRTMLIGSSQANGYAPGEYEVNGYWQPSGRRNLRVATRERREVGNVTTSLSEISYDSRWNPISSRRWDSTKPGASVAPVDATGPILNAANSISESSNWTIVSVRPSPVLTAKGWICRASRPRA